MDQKLRGQGIGSKLVLASFTPPIRTFIDENPAVKDKVAGIFVCYSGGGADKAIRKLEAYLGRDHIGAQLVLVDPKAKPSADNDKMIDAFAKKVG